MNRREYIKIRLREAGTAADDDQAEKFVTFYEMLIEKNKVMNLTAITEFEDVVTKHFEDSLMLSRVYDPGTCGRLIDLGTGAGFPGIPLKIMWPMTETVLADSLNKRIRFTRDVAEALGLERIRSVHGRAEDLAKTGEFREGFDCCVSRAVANLSCLSEYCLPFVRIGGAFVAYKSEKAGEEISKAGRAIAILGGEIEKVDEFVLPSSDIRRTLVLIRKTKETPPEYPRKAGKPSREPL